MSGPAVLRLSAYGALLLHRMDYRFSVEVNLLPGITPDQLTAHFLELKRRHGSRVSSRGFPRFAVRDGKLVDAYYGSGGAEEEEEEEGGEGGGITRRLWLYVLGRAGIGEGRRWDGTTDKELRTLATALLAGRSCLYPTLPCPALPLPGTPCRGAGSTETNS